MKSYKFGRVWKDINQAKKKDHIIVKKDARGFYGWDKKTKKNAELTSSFWVFVQHVPFKIVMCGNEWLDVQDLLSQAHIELERKKPRLEYLQEIFNDIDGVMSEMFYDKTRVKR